jgi:hypothetical protein
VLVGEGVAVTSQIQSSGLLELELDDVGITITLVLITVTLPPDWVLVMMLLVVKIGPVPTGRVEFPPGAGNGTEELELLESDELSEAVLVDLLAEPLTELLAELDFDPVTI